MKKFLTLFTALILLGSMMVVQAADYYVAGTMNSWNAGHSDYKMSGSGPYSLTKQLNSGDHKFKITQGSWSWSSNSYDQSASNVALSIDDGNIKFSLTTTSDVTFFYNASTGKAYVQAVAVVVPSYTFPNGTVIYYDFTAYNGGVNVCINGGEPYHENTTAIFCETLSSAWEVTATTNLFKSAPNSWSYKTCSTLPTLGQNMLVGDADGIGCHWDTYSGGMPEPTPATIQLHSNITNPSWESSANFALAGNEETASLTLKGVTKGDYEFGVKIDGTWTSNGSGFTRADPSHAIASGSGNCTFKADVAGDYTFTWTYETNTLAVTYPAPPTYTVDFVGLEDIYFVNDAVTFNATSTGVANPTYTYYVKKGDADYGAAVASYTFAETGSYTVKVEVRENGAGDALKTEEQTVTVDNPLTLYFVNKDAWENVNIYFFNPNKSDWPGDAMTATGDHTVGHNYAVYSYTVHASVYGSANVIFNNGDGSQTGDLDVETNHYFYNGQWYETLAECDPLPVIKLHGDFTGSWANTDAFVVAGNKETASLALTIPAKGTKSFGVRIGSDDNWTSNGSGFTRADPSHTIVAGEGNCSLNADIPGEYIFTWTYASNTLSVTYPDLPDQYVEFDGLSAQILKGTEVTFAATSSGITNPVYTYFVKQAGGEYGSAVAAYTFNAEGNFVVKVSAEGDNTAAPVVAEENVSVYNAHTFTSGTTIYVDFSAMIEGSKKVNYPQNNAVDLDYDENGAGTVKTITFSTDVTWTTNDVFIKTEKAGWDPGMKFTVPGEGKNCAVVAADGATYTWGTYDAPVVSVEAKGGWDGWAASLSFTPAPDGQTATATLAGLPAGNYAFKLIVGGGENWRSNENAFHRFWTSASGITENLDNMELQADADGDYVFTWTFATNALSIAFPENPKEGSNEVKFFPPRTEDHPWNNVYVYAWRRAASEEDNVPLLGEWPGVLATKDAEWYKVIADKGSCVIFHDNAGMQSFDIENVQKDACYIANVLDITEHELDPEKPIKAKFYESCTVEFYVTGDENIMGAGNAWVADLAERKLDGSNSITLHLIAGIYEFKLTNGSWAWSLGGKEHLNNACSNGAATTGNGNVKFKLESEQDVTISYNPATQKICLDAETVLPYEDVRIGLTADNYYTVCYNREMRQIRGASLWSFIGRTTDFAYIVKEDAPFAAGKPYILFAESDKLEAVLDGSTEDAGANGALHGTFSLMEQGALDGAGDNIYLVIGNELRRVDGQSGNKLPAYRAYVDVDEIDPIPSTDPNPAPGRQVRRMPMQKDVATGFESIEASDKPMKVMIDGTLYILRGENMYNVNGQIVK